MKILLLLASLEIVGGLRAQSNDTLKYAPLRKQYHLSFNPFGLLEPMVAIGPGASYRFTPRSSVFVETALLTASAGQKSGTLESLTGVRLIGQYRYHFFAGRKQTPGTFRPPVLDGLTETFFGLELRGRYYGFTHRETFINASRQDTLRNHRYHGRATVWGGAFLFGGHHALNRKRTLEVELTLGLGVKSKRTRLLDVPTGYVIADLRFREWGAPPIYESFDGPYLPWAVRLRYRLP